MAALTVPGPLPFAKLSGSGNDFILMDNRRGVLDSLDLPALARNVCRRQLSVGADGLIVIEPSATADFSWRFLNSDGSGADMCGNGGRCAARFAHLLGIAPASMRFETGAGIVAAEVRGPIVKLELTRPRDLKMDMVIAAEGMEYSASFVNTGVPHTVIFVQDVRMVDVEKKGRLIRHHQAFLPAGTNVNFATVLDRGRIRLRTYERGVEGETMACGTGSAATAMVAWRQKLTGPLVEIETSGGEVLIIHIETEGDAEAPRLYLEGKTILVCRGEIDAEAYA